MLDATIANCLALFHQEMELVTTLKENPNLKMLNTEVCELQRKYDEVALLQHLTKLQEGQQLHM